MNFVNLVYLRKKQCKLTGDPKVWFFQGSFKYTVLDVF